MTREEIDIVLTLSANKAARSNGRCCSSLMSRDYARPVYTIWDRRKPELEASDAPAIKLSRSIVCGGSLNAMHVPAGCCHNRSTVAKYRFAIRSPSCPSDFAASDAAISVALSSAASKNVMEKTKVAFLRRKSLEMRCFAKFKCINVHAFPSSLSQLRVMRSHLWRAMTSDHAIDFTTDENFCDRLGIPGVWYA